MENRRYTADEFFANWTESFSVYELYIHEDGTEDLKIISANKTFANLNGADYNTLTGRLFTDVCTSGLDWLPLYLQTAKQEDNGNLQEAYNEHLQKYLSTFVFSPKIGQVAVLVVDRTRLWRIEQRLPASNNDISTLISSMTTGFCIGKLIRDEQGNAIDMRFEMANAAFDRLEGFPTGTLPDKRLFEVRKEVPHFCKYVEAVERKVKITFMKQIASTGLILEAMCFSSYGDTLICIENDVTERVNAIKKNNDLAALVSDMTTGFCIGKLIRDEQGNAVDMRFEMANTAFDTLEGFPSGTLPGRRLFEVREVVPHFCKYVEAVEQKTKVMFTKPIASTGLILEAMCFSSGDDTLICIENDVTERVNAVKQNNDLAALVSAMTTGFSISKIIRDAQGNAKDMLFEMANAAFEMLEDLPIGTLPGKRLFEVRKTVPHFCKYVEAVESKKKVQFTKQIETTGRIMEVICFSSEGDTFICIENDVTERIKAAEQLQQTYTTIKRQNKTILSSIDYASKIQKNLLPKNSVFEEAFSDYSVLWNPRDIVGGDIYWIKSFEKGTVLCVCDCTGHGTPGALLTMLVASAFEDIVQESTCADTAQILYALDQRLVSVFGVHSDNQENEEMSDIKNGCDLAVLFIASDGSVSISAGQTHVFVCDGREVRQIKGQRLYVGEGRIKSKADIQTVNIPANPDNKFYIASDGLYDQMGETTLLPFGYTRFKELILQYHNEKQTVISDKVWEAFEHYRGRQPRRDDMELISFQV